MNEYLKKFRAQYPEYGDMGDTELAMALHSKFYADMAYADFAEKIGLSTGAGRTWEPSVEGMLRENTRRMGVDPDMSAIEFGNQAAAGAAMAVGGGVGRQGLGAAVNAIRGVRAARAAPMVTGALPGQYGATVPLTAPLPGRTAVDALRSFVKSPAVRGAASGIGTLEVLRRLFKGD